MLFLSCSGNLTQSELFEDEFENQPLGYLSTKTGALTAYHYLPEAGKKGNWTLSAFGRQSGYQTAWEIVEDEAGKYLRQNYYAVDESGSPLHPHTHFFLSPFQYAPVLGEFLLGHIQKPKRLNHQKIQ